MAILIDTTVSGAHSNSYLDVATVSQRLAGLGVCDDAWCRATNDQQAQFLITSARRLDRLRFIGSRANPTQSMEWPRIGGSAPYSLVPYWYWQPFYGSVYAGIYDFRQRFLPGSAVPDVVTDAQLALICSALQAACAGSGTASTNGCQEVQSISAYGVQVQYWRPATNVAVPDDVMELLGDVVLTGSGIVKA